MLFRSDLLDDLKRGDVTLEKVETKALPAEMQPLNLDQRKAYLKQKEGERGRIQARIAELSRQRQAYLDADAKKRSAAGKGDSFDEKVGEALREQAKRKGIRYATPGK